MRRYEKGSSEKIMGPKKQPDGEYCIIQNWRNFEIDNIELDFLKCDD